MSEAILTMKRYEIKYILDKTQVKEFCDRIKNRMTIDEYGLTSIASLYYDTPDKRLIRNSVEKPEFKEKIRLRSYGLAKDGSTLYLELKRKAYGIVYKRRAATSQKATDEFFNCGADIDGASQISKEISYFRDYYKNLVPSCLIIYDRVAYLEKDGDLRLTIDYNPRYREKDLNLYTSMEGKSLLPEGYAVLEVKAQESVPLWLSGILSDLKIYKGSFSKYGEAYRIETENLRRAI